MARWADRPGEFKSSLRPVTVRGSTRFDPRSRRSRFVSRRPRWAPGKVCAAIVLKRLRARKEWKFFAVLPRANRPLAIAWWIDRRAAGRAAGGFRHRHGHARRRRSSTATALAAGLAFVGVDLRPAAGPHADPSGRRRQPGRPHGGLALRSADRSLRPPARDGAPRRSRAYQRPDRRPRLRPGHDRAAAVHLDGLHRQRPGRNDRRPGVGRRAGRLRLVGADRARRRVAGDALALARKRRLARPQHRPKSAAPSATPTTPIGWPSIRRPAKSCGSSVWLAGRSTASSTAARGCISCNTRRRVSRERPVLWSMLLVVGANVIVFWRWPPRP